MPKKVSKRQRQELSMARLEPEKIADDCRAWFDGEQGNLRFVFEIPTANYEREQVIIEPSDPVGLSKLGAIRMGAWLRDEARKQFAAKELI